MSKQIRLAVPEDAQAILDIYAPFVLGSTVTAEEAVPTITEFRVRMERIMEKYPWLVCCDESGEIMGYSYASRHQERAAYKYSVNLSIYVNPKFHRNYIATDLYKCLLELLKMQGYKNAFAAVIIPNPQSAAFHHSLGFRPAGVFTNVTYKLGRWNDMEWFQYIIAVHSKNAVPPISLCEALTLDKFDEIIRKYNNE